MSALKDILKPTPTKAILACIFLGWHYFYSYLGIKTEYFAYLGDYFKIGLGGVNWNNYFIRSGFMVLLWVLVALFIYLCIWGYESYKINAYNAKIKKEYLNRPKSEYENLLVSGTMKVKTHLKFYLYYAGAIAMFISALAIVSDLIEGVRMFINDSFVTNMFENGVDVGSSGTGILVISFILTFLFWCIYSSIIVWVFAKGKNEQSSIKIGEDHFAVVVENPEDEEDVEN